MPKIRHILGYVPEAEALRLGMTHHGRYFFVPVWMGNVGTDTPQVLEKVLWLGWLLGVCHVIEGLLSALFWPDAEPAFQFTIVREIDNKRE